MPVVARYQKKGVWYIKTHKGKEYREDVYDQMYAGISAMQKATGVKGGKKYQIPPGKGHPPPGQVNHHPLATGRGSVKGQGAKGKGKSVTIQTNKLKRQTATDLKRMHQTAKQPQIQAMIRKAVNEKLQKITEPDGTTATVSITNNDPSGERPYSGYVRSEEYAKPSGSGIRDDEGEDEEDTDSSTEDSDEDDDERYMDAGLGTNTTTVGESEEENENVEAVNKLKSSDEFETVSSQTFLDMKDLGIGVSGDIYETVMYIDEQDNIVDPMPDYNEPINFVLDKIQTGRIKLPQQTIGSANDQNIMVPYVRTLTVEVVEAPQMESIMINPQRAIELGYVSANQTFVNRLNSRFYFMSEPPDMSEFAQLASVDGKEPTYQSIEEDIFDHNKYYDRVKLEPANTGKIMVKGATDINVSQSFDPVISGIHGLQYQIPFQTRVKDGLSNGDSIVFDTQENQIGAYLPDTYLHFVSSYTRNNTFVWTKEQTTPGNYNDLHAFTRITRAFKLKVTINWTVSIWPLGSFQNNPLFDGTMWRPTDEGELLYPTDYETIKFNLGQAAVPESADKETTNNSVQVHTSNLRGKFTRDHYNLISHYHGVIHHRHGDGKVYYFPPLVAADQSHGTVSGNRFIPHRSCTHKKVLDYDPLHPKKLFYYRDPEYRRHLAMNLHKSAACYPAEFKSVSQEVGIFGAALGFLGGWKNIVKAVGTGLKIAKPILNTTGQIVGKAADFLEGNLSSGSGFHRHVLHQFGGHFYRFGGNYTNGEEDGPLNEEFLVATIPQVTSTPTLAEEDDIREGNENLDIDDPSGITDEVTSYRLNTSANPVGSQVFARIKNQSGVAPVLAYPGGSMCMYPYWDYSISSGVALPDNTMPVTIVNAEPAGILPVAVVATDGAIKTKTAANNDDVMPDNYPSITLPTSWQNRNSISNGPSTVPVRPTSITVKLDLYLTFTSTQDATQRANNQWTNSWIPKLNFYMMMKNDVTTIRYRGLAEFENALRHVDVTTPQSWFQRKVIAGGQKLCCGFSLWNTPLQTTSGFSKWLPANNWNTSTEFSLANPFGTGPLKINLAHYEAADDRLNCSTAPREYAEIYGPGATLPQGMVTSGSKFGVVYESPYRKVDHGPMNVYTSYEGPFDDWYTVSGFTTTKGALRFKWGDKPSFVSWSTTAVNELLEEDRKKRQLYFDPPFDGFWDETNVMAAGQGFKKTAGFFEWNLVNSIEPVINDSVADLEAKTFETVIPLDTGLKPVPVDGMSHIEDDVTSVFSV